MAVDASISPISDSQSRDTGKRPGEKRLTLALDGETYKRLRRHAAETGQTHQAILEGVLFAYLSANASPKYKACPFCGSGDVFGSCLIGEGPLVTCNTCGCEAPRDIWNTRARVAS